MAPSSVVLHDEGPTEDDVEKDEERELMVCENTGFVCPHRCAI